MTDPKFSAFAINSKMGVTYKHPSSFPTISWKENLTPTVFLSSFFYSDRMALKVLFSSPFILEQFEYCPSWISCKTLWQGWQNGALDAKTQIWEPLFFGVWLNNSCFKWGTVKSPLQLPWISIKASRKKTVISPTITKVKNMNKLLQVTIFLLFNYRGCQNKKKKISIYSSPLMEQVFKANKIVFFQSVKMPEKYLILLSYYLT